MNRNILILLTIFFTLISCETKQDIIKENITETLKEKMNNPDSFQFVSMNIKKTISVGERKEVITAEKLKEVYGTLGDSKLFKQYQTEFKFLQKQTDDNKDAVYYVDFVVRGENSYGAIIKKEYTATVLNDEEYTVVSFKE